ncbi:MAG: family 10 glycosylhydrolase [Muribaculaceae bacterium]|nr:family 10 glycosylhydrolase [Muribaculaceae bacterium]
MQKFAIRLILFLSILFFATQKSIADTYPKREMRSAWIATVWNLDWPKNDAGSAYTGTSSTVRNNQKTYLRNMIQKLKASGFNAVNFQVRGMCDAMYNSSYEPWSSALTGKRGTAPYGNWDPLAYCIEVCHEFGMECHAWVNPFRFSASSTLYETTNDMTLRNNGWIITYAATDENGDVTSTTSVLNPGIEDVRNYIVENVCKEIVQNYDIDGLVWDDYFYPNGIPSTIDVGDYPQYQSYINSGGTMNMGDWRRDNINKTVKLAFDMIQREKPYVKFGVAPAGVANVGAKAHGIEPAKISSNGYQYNGIFADPCAWIIDGYIDYISPQLYWTTNHQSAPFNPLCEWWNNLAATYGVQCYISHDIAGSTSIWNNNSSDYTERFNQIAQVRNSSADFNPGEVFYSAGFINGPRTSGLGDYLKENLYQHYALTPKIVRSDEETIIVNPGTVDDMALNGSTLSWGAKNMSVTGYNLSNIPMRYAVYAIPLNTGANDAKSTIHTNDGGYKADYLLDITYNNSFDVSSYSSSSYWYAVTIVDRFGYEWEAATLNAPNLGNVSLSLNSPATASVLSFGDNTFSWTSDGTSFTFQISTSEDFTAPLIEQVVTTKNITFSTADLTDGATYYWRVIASKESYNSAWSEIRSFTMETRPTIAITLLTPENTSTINTETIPFSWEGIDGASYTFELAEYSSFNDILISTNTTATSYEIPTTSLTGGKTYFWRIKASRDGYQSSVSDYASFITPKVEGETIDGLTIEEKWIKSVNTGNFPNELNTCVSARSMAAYNGNVYILERASETDCSLLEFNGETGAYIKTISLSGDIYTSTIGNIAGWNYQPGNCIFADGAGNLYISSLTVTSEIKPLTVCSVDITTGKTTKIFEAELTSSRYRIDYANAFGDLTKTGGQIWAATTTDKVFRWTRNSDGSWTEESTTISDFYPNSATKLDYAPSIQPISATQFIVDGGATHPSLYTFNRGGNAILDNSFANNAAIQPTNTNYNGTYSITIGSTPLFIYVNDIHSFSIVANKHDFDFAQFQFMKSVPENKLGTTGHSWNLDQPVAINNNDGSVTVFLYAPLNGLAAYRISLPEIEISLNSPANNATFEEDFDFSWSGVEGASYTLEISKTATFEDIVFNATTTSTSYNSSNFNLASETQYFWRVKASHPNYTSATSEIRQFTSPFKQSAANNLTITELWNKSVNNGNTFPSQLGGVQYSMVAYNDKVYVITRNTGALLEFNGSTGDYIRTITLTGDCFTNKAGNKLGLPTNCIFVDGAGNLCVSNLVTNFTSSEQLTVCTINIETGVATRIFQSNTIVTMRIDYANAFGDITKEGGQIWGAVSGNGSSNHNRIYRWTRKSDGSWAEEYTTLAKFYPTNGNLGGAPWIMPISETDFIADGSGNAPTLYTFISSGNATYKSGFDSKTDLAPTKPNGAGVGQITLGKYPLFIYNNNTHSGDGYSFNIVHNPSSYNFSLMEKLKTVPENYFGKESYTNVLNQIATIKNSDNSATIFVYAPNNGLAAYRISLPNVPITLNTPINNAQAEDGFDFMWTGVEGASYTIELSATPTFDEITYSATTNNNIYSSNNITSLPNSTTYYWRIKASHNNYTTTTSAVGQFTTPKKPHLINALYYPNDKDVFNNDIVFISIKPYVKVDGQVSYADETILEISKTEDFSELYFSGYQYWDEVSTEDGKNGDFLCLQRTLPISYFSNGTYYWRIRANKSGYDEAISEVRSFEVIDQSNETGSTEANYKIKREDYEYIPISANGSQYILTNLWVRNATINNLGQSEASGDYRGFCARSAKYGDQNGIDILWVARHNSGIGYLDRYNATTGERLTSLTLKGSHATSTYPCNDVFTDDSGNLCIMNLKNTTTDILQIATVNPNTGETTVRFNLSVPERIDHARIVGDINSGSAYIIAVSAAATIYRWEIYDGELENNGTYESTTITTFYPTDASRFGTAARIYPIDKDYFYIDGSGSAFTLYKFGTKSPISTFAAFTDLIPSSNSGNGGSYFTHDGKSFIIYPSSSFNRTDDTINYKFTLANVSSFTEWSSASKYWTLPTTFGFGTLYNAGGDYGMLADYLQYNALTGQAKSMESTYDRTNIYLYVPGNGMAAYSLTRHVATGAESINSENINININSQDITFGCDVDNAQLYTLSGMLLNSVENASSIEKPINKGVYILNITINGNTTIHKIII